MTTHFFKAIGLVIFHSLVAPFSADAHSVTLNESVENRAFQLENRLKEIKELDKKSLSNSEKKVLRKEVREIKKQLAAISGGVYLSIGAILLIALLLILLL
jgi:hypothetical protein